MSRGYIRQLSSPFGAPVLFPKKPDARLQFCIDYRDINSKTINDQYPLPWIKKTSSLLRKARVYSKLDMRGAYNLFHIKEGDEY